MLVKLLARRLGRSDQELAARLSAISDPARLTTLLDLTLSDASAEELRGALGDE